MIERYISLEHKLYHKSILLVGGGPDANLLTSKEYDSFDYIIRINNFKYANECKRTDFWYSYFGRNIKNLEDRIEQENIKALICKYPIDIEIGGLNVSELRDPLWNKINIPVYVPNITESIQTNNSLDISPTAGFAAILSILKVPLVHLTIIGFDFFASKIHDLNEEWDSSGGHKPEIEKEYIENLENKGLMWVRK